MAQTPASVKQQVSEYFRCKKDPIYFIENYIQLELPGGNQLMKLYEPQKKLIKSMLVDHHIVALKSRQIGISTLTQAFIAYVFTFYKNVVVGIVSRDGPEATDFCRKTMSMLNNLPDFLRPKFSKDTEQTFILDNGCKFYASQVNESKPGGLFRGKSITIAIIDEAAYIKKIDDAYTGMAPALFKSQKIASLNNIPFGTIIISTPNRTVGLGKWYYNHWKTAWEKDSIFKPHKIHWKDVKEFSEDPTWYKTQCDLLGNVEWKIQQELEMKFIASSNSFFPSDTVLKLNDAETEPCAIIEVHNHELYQFVRPDPNKFYLIGVDTASQSGNDYSAIQVVDYETFEQCAEFKAKLRVDEFCKVIDMVNRIYSNNLLVVENNSYGNQVVEFLTQTGTFYRLYQPTAKNNTTNTNTKFRYGLYTGPQTRPLIVDALYTMVKEDPMVVNGKRTILELIGLVAKVNGRVEADEGENDDLSFALAFCAYVKMYDPPLGMASQFIHRNLADQVVDVVNMTFDEQAINPEIFGIPVGPQEDRIGAIEKTNKIMHSHIKKNLHKLMQENGSVIDISQLMGFNAVTGERDSQNSKPSRIQSIDDLIQKSS